MDRSSKQKINKETQVLNDTLDEMDLIDIFRTFHPNAEEYTFFSSAHGTFSRIDHILGHKSNFSKFKKIKIISSIFSDHSAMRVDINYKKKKSKKHKNMEIKQCISKEPTDYWRYQKGNKTFSRNKQQWKHDTQILRDAAKAVLRGKFIVIQSYLKKQEKHRINNLTLHLKQLEKEEQKIPKISRRKGIINIWAEINEKEMKENSEEE